MKKEEKTNKNSIERQKFQLHKKGYEGVTEAIKDLKEEKPEVQKMELMGAEIITIKGAKGDKGDSIKGDKGDSIKGDKGDKGDKGEDSTVKGPKGPKGDKGNDSIVPGPKGNDSKVKGPKGDKGNDGSPDSPKEIVSKLQGVKKKWLSIEAIDGDFNAKVRKQVLLNGASSSLKQLTDVDYSGLEQDSKGNYILGSGGVESVVAGTNVTVDDTDPQNPIVSASSGSSSPLTTKGDLYTYSTTDARLPVGADGEVIVADSSETTGIKWIANSGSDEKVKYDAADPTAGYVADKIIAGTGISVAEGTGASENKLVITNDSPETPVTVTDTAEIDLTLTGQDIQADIKTGSIDVLKLDSGVQDSLALADSALQSEVDTLQSVTDRGTISTNDLTFPKLIGGSTTTSDLTLQTTSGVGATGADMHFLTGNNGATEAMTILNSGNVGIGTTSPTIPLVVGSGGDPGSATIAAFINTNNGGAASIMIQNDVDNSAVETNEIISRAANRNNGKILFGRDADQSTADNADGFLALYTALNGNNVEAMRIDSDGNVGIGTTSPVEKLDVQTTGVFAAGINTAMQLSAFDTGSFSSGDGVGLLFKFVDRSAAPGYGKIAVIKQNHDTSSSMLFQTSLAGTLHTQMLIDNAGNVGIGTTAPAQALDVVGKIALNDGGNSVFIGEGAGLNDDGTDNRNVGIGYHSLYSNTTGSNNTANGYQSLRFNTTGNYNTANGYKSLYLNTTGSSNTANGYTSLYLNTTGSSNTANGYTSLYSNTTGNNNTTNGYRSLYSNTTGNNNTANGYVSLYNSGKTLTAGAFVTGVSYTIISAGTTDFTAIGSANNTVGTIFTATGAGTGTGTASGNANNNLANGYQAGRYFTGSADLTAPSNSTFLGYNTMALADGGTNEIVIGYSAVGIGDNSVVLGNDSVTKTILKGNVGIGTTLPDTKLHNTGGYTQGSLSADPADPSAGNTVQWVSDGTASGDAGDVMMKINVGATVKTVTLVDFSTLS